MKISLRTCVGGLLAALVGLSSALAGAAPFPERAVKIIVPLAPGAAGDTACRVVARKLSEYWGQPVVLDNRPGAGGVVSAASAVPDGYNFMLGLGSLMVTTPLLNKKLSYHPQRDFVPVGRLVTNYYVLLSNPATGIRTVADLVAAAKKKPGELNFGSAGAGSPSHLIMEMFEYQTGTKVFPIAYKSGAPAITDLIAGQVQLGLSAIPSVVSQVKAGKLVALAVTSPQRDPLLPAVPTMEEAGIPHFRHSLWYGLFAPTGTPPAIVAKVGEDLRRALQDPEVVRQLAEQGALADPSTPQQFSQMIQSETERWAKLIKDRNLKLD